jgi:hypothetical protein
MKDEIDAAGCAEDTCVIANITNIEFQLFAVEFLSHIILLLLIAAEYPDFANRKSEEAPQDGVTERTGTPRNQQTGILKHQNHFCSVAGSGLCRER